MTSTAMNPAFRDEYADVNGVRLHYVQAGSGPLILFAHGFPEFWYAWKEQIAAFAADHLAVAPDLRGYNLSAKPAAVEDYAVREVVADLCALADHLGAPQFVLVGHDWGGVVAWALALSRPERLEKLVIVNAPHPAIFARELRENRAQQQASQYMLLFRSPQAEQTLAANDYAALERIVLADGLARGYFTEADRAAYRAAWAQPGALTGSLNYYRATALGPAAPPSDAAPPPATPGAAVPPLRVPTLVIWGEQDTALLPGNLVGLEDVVPGVTIRRTPDGSHWVVHEHPELVTRYIREFLDDGGAGEQAGDAGRP